VTLGEFAARPVNKDAAHCLGGGGKKVSAIFKFWIFGAHQSQPCLMHQFGGLQCLARRFSGHLAGGQPTQFLVNEFKQLFGRR